MKKLKWFWWVIIISISSLVLLLVGVFISFGIIASGGCERWQTVTFQNNTPYPIKIVLLPGSLDYPPTTLGATYFYEDAKVKPIEPGQAYKGKTTIYARRNIGIRFRYSIYAMSEAEGVVFSKVYTWDELHDMGWRVIITVGG